MFYSFVITDVIYKKPELRHLFQLLAPVAHQYLQIGILLNVPDMGLDPLPHYHQSNLQRILKYWLSNGDRPAVNSPVMWKTIIDIMKGPVIKNYTVAKTIEDFLCELANYTHYMNKTSGQSSKCMLL